jgi:hypothetical protein
VRSLPHPAAVVVIAVIHSLPALPGVGRDLLRSDGIHEGGVMSMTDWAIDLIALLLIVVAALLWRRWR